MSSKTNLSLFAVLAASALVAATPVIKAGSVRFSQNADTRLVTIGYTLEDADAVVTVDVLTNGVSIGEENFTNIDGDVNKRVAPGDRLIVWHPRASWPDHVFTNGVLSVKVRPWDVAIPPDYLVVDLTATIAPVHYYVSTNALPAGGLTNDIYRTAKMVLRRIPAGATMWTMGSPESEKYLLPGTSLRYGAREMQRLVTMTNDYYLGVFPVTVAQHRYATGDQKEGGDTVPVTHETYVQLRGASDWPTTGHEVASGSDLMKWRNLTGVDFDLPTSAQWEFACRAGTSTIFYFGSDTNKLSKYAWYKVNSGNARHRVGEKIPNGFGLYDLYGNVWEWCLDWTGGISADPVVEPTGPDSSSESKRVGRGGMWASDVDGCRSAKINPQVLTSAYGYRLLCPPTLKW